MAIIEQLPEGFTKIHEGHYRNSDNLDFYSIRSFKEAYSHIDDLRISNNKAQNQLESNEPLLHNATKGHEKIEIIFSESTRSKEGWAYKESLLQDFYELKGINFLE